MPAGEIETLKWRRTKIVATLGPSSDSPDTIRALIGAGVSVFRLNLSHGDHETHRQAYQAVRAASEATGTLVAVLADLSGPKIRVGRFDGGGVDLVEGAEVTVTTRDVVGAGSLIPSQYTTLHEEVGPGARILLDDGNLELRVGSVVGTEIGCEVIRGGRLKDRKGMNLPDSALTAPALTAKDRADARFVLELGVDYVALSFVRTAADIDSLRSILSGDEPPKIIAKIERPEALTEIEAIIAAADGLMVARGDLGVELPPEDVPVIQNELIRRARIANKPCIVATQMLESMIEHGRPTRAEVSDVSTAVFSEADAVMLSAETASGRYPVAAVEMMHRIARRVEADIFAERRFRVDRPEYAAGTTPLDEAVARATVSLSRDLGCRAIVVFSTAGTGTTARIVSAARPPSPILGVAGSPRAALQMALLWGVLPIRVTQEELADPERLASQLAIAAGLAEPGDPILTVGGFRGTEADIPVISVLRASRPAPG